MDDLPAELILYVAHFLAETDVVSLLSTSKRIRALVQDNELWRRICYDKSYVGNSRWAVSQASSAPDSIQNQAAAALSTANGIGIAEPEPHLDQHRPSLNPTMERVRAMTNWDPAYPGEKFDWYAEYIARYGPLSISWLEPTAAHDNSRFRLETRGLGLYASQSRKHVVAPLDDGTVCIWNVGHEPSSAHSRGSILARSKAGLLSTQTSHGQQNVSKAQLTSTGVVECVSVDSVRNKAYIAVQSTLHEVDLNTLQISAYEKYPFSISALSSSDENLPLTVGTSLSLHIHDRRQANNHRSEEADMSRVDSTANFPRSPRQGNDFSRLLYGDDEPSDYASLFQPGPLSIHHLSPQNARNSASQEIYVAGRFPSVLVYDRRTFPRLRTNFHSGARLCSLTSLPFSFKCLESDLMRKRQLSLGAVAEAKNCAGDRLIACGDYNGKGSLEIFGLSPDRGSTDFPPSQQAGVGQTSTFKNRVSAGRSRLLSVVPHGTRLLVSDSDGNLRWFERDGSSFVRAWNINSFAQTEPRSLFSMSYAPLSGDVARKLIPLTSSSSSPKIEEDEILVWTGERIGVLGFVKSPRFGGSNGERWNAESVEERLQQREERIYGETMRRALEGQADEVRVMQGLGIGPDIN